MCREGLINFLTIIILKYMKKLLLPVFLLCLLILPNIVLAEEEGEGATIVGMVANVTGIIVVVGTTLVIIFWIITGLMFLSAQGAPEKLTNAKRALYMAIAGTALVILAQVAQTIIENALFVGI